MNAIFLTSGFRLCEKSVYRTRKVEFQDKNKHLNVHLFRLQKSSSSTITKFKLLNGITRIGSDYGKTFEIIIED